MKSLAPLSFIFLAVYTLFPLAFGASSTSFCKCTCDKNSTIIPLDAPNPRSTSPPSLLVRNPLNGSPSITFRGEESKGKDGEKHEENKDGKEYRALNCNDCNKQFCLSYNLPICKGVDEEKVFTTCFRRDSRKDEAVVFIFIFATAGLLGWAAIKPWVGKWVENVKERRNYMPLAHEGADES